MRLQIESDDEKKMGRGLKRDVEEEEEAVALVNNKDPSIIKVVAAANLRLPRFLVQRWDHQMRVCDRLDHA